MSETVIQNAPPTKLISTRITIPEYIKLLNIMQERRMSVSEYLQYKLYQDDKVIELTNTLSEAESRIKDLEEMVSENRGYAEGWKKTAEKHQTELSALQKQISALNEAEKRYKGEIATDSKTVSELKAKVQQLDADNKKRSEIIAKWSEALTKRKTEDSTQSELLWETAHKKMGGTVPEWLDKGLKFFRR